MNIREHLLFFCFPFRAHLALVSKLTSYRHTIMLLELLNSAKWAHIHTPIYVHAFHIQFSLYPSLSFSVCTKKKRKKSRQQKRSKVVFSVFCFIVEKKNRTIMKQEKKEKKRKCNRFKYSECCNKWSISQTYEELNTRKHTNRNKYAFRFQSSIIKFYSTKYKCIHIALK